MRYRSVRRCARWLTGPIVLSLLTMCLASLASASDPTCYAFVSIDEPNDSPYYAPQSGTANVPFSTYDHRVEIYGAPSAQYCVTWTMTLRCTTNWGGNVAYVDTDWGGQCPAVMEIGRAHV